MRHSIVFLLLAPFLLAGCGDRTGSTGRPGDRASGPPTVATVNYPLAYFAERIGGDAIRVRFPAPPDEDPAYWNPDDEALGVYQAADRVLLNGAGYAKWVSKVSLAGSRLVDTSAAAQDRFIELKEATTHAHGPEGQHVHEGTAFTTWLDPAIAKVQAEAVRDALIQLSPEHAETFRANAAALVDDLTALDEEIRAVVARQPGQPVVFSHPVYQYFARAYDLNARAVHWEPDTLPDDDAWTAFQALREDFPTRWMVWEGPPIPASVAKLQTVGVESRVFDPCGNRPESGDFLRVMRENVRQLGEVFAP